ncbi:MAG: TfoX family protein [Candidatus Electrothrix sp. AR4]|nr:TfoX family protein [Candidatus Electrothrix sp. AR4]
MAISNDFLEYILDQLSAWRDVTAQRMFGGAGLFRDGKMFGLIADNVAYLKVDETNKDKFLVAGSAPFKPFPNKPTILSYFEIPPDILENPEELIEWADESLSIQKRGK